MLQLCQLAKQGLEASSRTLKGNPMYEYEHQVFVFCSIFGHTNRGEILLSGCTTCQEI